MENCYGIRGMQHFKMCSYWKINQLQVRSLQFGLRHTTLSIPAKPSGFIPYSSLCCNKMGVKKKKLSGYQQRSEA